VGNFEKSLVTILVVAGIAAIIAYNLMKQQRDTDRANARHRAEQQIASDRLNPLSFQNRCGLAPSHKRDGRSFMISYPAENVAVSFLSDEADSTSFKQVDYWSMKPLVPITLSDVVSRLNCSPRP
jgi:type II secretory pathway pseudopilin PulG